MQTRVVVRVGQAYRLTAVVESEFDSAGGSPVAVEESLGNQGREVDCVRHGFGVSALIEGAAESVLSEGWVINQVSRAVNCVGRINVKGVAVGGNSKHDLFRREASISPSLNGLYRGARLNV